MSINGGGDQRGVVLIVVLIMLGVFSVIVMSMLGGSNINFKIAGNHQFRFEAKSAAQASIEAYISNPANFTIPLPEIDAIFSFDLDGNGTNDLSATVAPPVCLRSMPVKLAALDASDPGDDSCWKSGQSMESGVFGDSITNGNSDCAEISWDVKASVKDTSTDAAVVMHQGIYLRANVGTTCS